MLDFESSIEAELSAELLTGKNINLEKARGLALEGKSAEAAAEILKQVGGTAEFSKMNVIQQEAMAKAVGLTREGLADSLIEREALEAMSAREGDTALQAYEKLKASGKTEAEMVELLGEKTAEQLKQQSAQDKFNTSIEKLKEIFVQVMDAVAPIFDVLSSIVTTVLPAINFAMSPFIKGFQMIGSAIDYFVEGLKKAKGPAIALGIAIGLMVAPLITSAIASIFKGLASLGPLGVGLATVGTMGFFGLLAQGKSKAKTGNDIMSPGGGFSGYGKRTLFGPEGAIQLNDKDTVIAGTNLFGNDVKSEPGKATEMAGKGEIKVKSEGGGKIDMTQTNTLLQQLINLIQTGGDVILDGQKVGTALKLGSFKTQ
jgi:hypothetical protein